MAQILAEQGDLDGALIIYEELAAQNPDSADLKRKIGELRRQKTDSGDRSRYASLDTAAEDVAAVASPAAPEEAEHAVEAKQSDKNVMALLEDLAGRLEARAGV